MNGAMTFIKVLVIILIFLYICKIKRNENLVNMILTRGKGSPRKNAHYSYLKQFFGTGDLEKDMLTYKNTLQNSKVNKHENW